MRRDIIHSDGDLIFMAGDFAIDESDERHVEDIILSQKGEWKEYPLVGFGAINYVKTRVSPSEFKRDLKIQLEYDNYKNVNIDLSNGFENLKIELNV